MYSRGGSESPRAHLPSYIAGGMHCHAANAARWRAGGWGSNVGHFAEAEDRFLRRPVPSACTEYVLDLH